MVALVLRPPGHGPFDDFGPAGKSVVQCVFFLHAFRCAQTEVDVAQAVVEIGSHDGNDTGVIFTEGLENGAQRAWRVRSLHRHVDTVNACAADGDEDFKDILIGDDADQHTVIVHNGQASDFFIQHEQRRRSHRISAFDCDGLRGHDVPGLDFCQKVTGKRSFGGLSAEHFMVSLMVYPEDWKGVHMIKVEDAALRDALGIEGKRGALTDFFAADGTYRMDAIYQRHKSTDDAMEKAILKVDERCALVVMLINGELVKPVPAGVERPSEAVVSAEILYDAAPWSLILFIVTFVMSVVLLFLVLSGKATVLNIPANVVVLVDTVALAVLYGLRWAIQGHVPMSNGYETMLFIALVAQLFAASLVVGRISRISLLTALAMIISAFALLVSHLSFMSPEMTPLMPVLQSPLLSIHVSTIMVAYALFAILTLVSVAALIAYRRGGAQAEHMTLVCELLLYPAVFLLTTGIFLGAVWANVSWGTYWSWDPKETWALITLMVYAAPLHRHSVRMFSEPRKYHIYIICAFVSVLVTYFGVNYLLGGMHSYA